MDVGLFFSTQVKRYVMINKVVVVVSFKIAKNAFVRSTKAQKQGESTDQLFSAQNSKRDSIY